MKEARESPRQEGRAGGRSGRPGKKDRPSVGVGRLACRGTGREEGKRVGSPCSVTRHGGVQGQL